MMTLAIIRVSDIMKMKFRMPGTKKMKRIIAIIAAVVIVASIFLIFLLTATTPVDDSAQREYDPTARVTVAYLPEEYGAFPVQIHEITAGSRMPQFIGEPIGQPGWLFNGWSPLTENYVYEDTVFEALWIRNPDMWFTVIYDPGAQGDFLAEEFDLKLYGTPTPVFGDGSIPQGNMGWEFLDWTTELADYVTDNATYVAQWERTDGMWAEITFESGDHSVDADVVHEYVLIGGQTPTVPNFTGDPGWAFMGWTPEIADYVTGNTTYLAQWRRVDGMWFTIEYDPGLFGTFNTQTNENIFYGSFTPVFVGEPTGQLGWVFDHWIPEWQLTVADNVTYVAQWVRQDDYWFTVTYDPGEQGVFEVDVHEYIPRDSQTPEFMDGAIPTGNYGWEFVGWESVIAPTVTEDATYVAQWARTPSYWAEITFESGDQSADADIVYEYVLIGDQTPAAPEFTGDPGWEFIGWISEIADYVTENVTYVAQWGRIDGMWFTLAYDPGLFGTFDTQIHEYVLYGTFAPVFVGEPTGQPGWVFDYWIPEWQLTVADNATYVAQWARQDGYWFTVTYDPGEQGVFEADVHENIFRDSQTPEFMEGATPTGNFGWEFVGWESVIAPTVTEDVTYVAQWSEIIIEPEPEYPEDDIYDYVPKDVDDDETPDERPIRTPHERPIRTPQTGIEGFILLGSALFSLALLVGTTTAVKAKNKKRDESLDDL